ncbi:ATP-dependent DNA helicase PIF1-like protein [Tanacetum coccineum]|uniref:ATP-dependent DNA helicase PIF1-like protein n=1 Tax=Tanacetum coccineum TaxID=301880 RepID=A0ABQ4XE37_9ASTR
MDSALLSGLLAEGDVLIYGGANDSGLSNGSHIRMQRKMDPKNHTISLFSLVKKEITAEDFFKGGIKKMVGSIRDSDSSFHCILYAKIHKIHREHGWTYLAYKRCGRSAKEVNDGQSSSSDKVIVRVIDDTGSSSLLLFDDMLFKYSEKEGFDPENHFIVQFTSIKKEVIVEDFFRGGVKTMVGHIRDSDSVCSSSTFSRKSYSCTYTRAGRQSKRKNVGKIAQQREFFIVQILVSDVDINFNFSESLYTTEFLNTIKMSGIPHHELVLKIGAPVMCMRNIDQRGGLCNGTRLQVLRMSKINIECKIVSGSKVVTVVAIPRMNISPSDKKMHFQLNRRQFPVALCFAITINKSQRQTLSKVGLFLEKPIFSYGQLYVAVSRVKSIKGLKVLCCDKDGNYCNYTTNVVLKEVLHRL